MVDRNYTHELPHQAIILRVIALFTMVGGCLFGVLNYQRELYLLSAVEFLMAALAGVFFVLLKSKFDPRKWMLMFVICFCLVMMWALYDPKTQATVFVWMFLIPVLSYTALGQTQGLTLTSLFGGVACVLLFVKQQSSDQFIDIVDVINVLVSWLLVWAVCHTYEQSRANSQQVLLHLSSRDVLTGLYTRHRLQQLFAREKAWASREGGCLSLVVCNIDNFKRINDDYGMEVGDQVLKVFARLLRQNIRKTDYAIRMNGDEFYLLLPGADLLRATIAAKLLCEKFARESVVVQGVSFSVSVRAGVAEYLPDAGLSLDELCVQAQEKVAIAKSLGGNQAVGADVDLPAQSDNVA